MTSATSAVATLFESITQTSASVVTYKRHSGILHGVVRMLTHQLRELRTDGSEIHAGLSIAHFITEAMFTVRGFQVAIRQFCDHIGIETLGDRHHTEVGRMLLSLERRFG